MSLILCIDTALQLGSVSLSKDGKCIAVKYSDEQQAHASFLQPAIQSIMETADLPLTALDGVAVSNGPGSYTGLRVGLASAKGLCFALNIPLITISTLEVMAMAIKQQMGAQIIPHFLCPMIDARRMEVFTAVYNDKMEVVVSAAAVVLQPDFLHELIAKHTIYFAGNGVNKFKELVSMTNAVYIENLETVNALSVLAAQYFQQNNFANLMLAEPFYCKAFYQPMPLK